jgi:hypothetical protein
MDARATIVTTLVFVGTATLVWSVTPRLMRDVTHAGDYVPARSHTLTDYRCTNVNLFMFNHCSATFVSPQAREPQEITDWRFGRAPREMAQLLELRDDVSSVTTDVSLRTVWNRMAAALMLVAFGVLFAVSLIMKSLRTDDTPADGSAAIPAREPARAARVERSDMRGFGRRVR